VLKNMMEDGLQVLLLNGKSYYEYKSTKHAFCKSRDVTPVYFGSQGK
jgi:hypothetical protein